jgi:hypothetical protein
MFLMINDLKTFINAELLANLYATGDTVIQTVLNFFLSTIILYFTSNLKSGSVVDHCN